MRPSFNHRSIRPIRITYGLLALLFLIHVALLAYYVPDIPIMDEWDIWYGWKDGFWNWLVLRHNEHMIIPSRLHMYFSTLLVGAHPKLLAITSFLVFGLLLHSLIRLFKWVAPTRSPAIIASYLIFFLSAVPMENHISGFNSVFHFVLLFMILSLRQLFADTLSIPRAALGTLFLLLSLVSFATAPAQILGVLAIFAPFWWQKRTIDPRSFITSLTVLGIVGFAIALWMMGHHSLPGHPIPSLPFTGGFNGYFVNLVSWGFGVQSTWRIWGVFFLLACFIPMVGLLKSRADNRSYACIAGLMGIFCALASIAYGRGGFGVLTSKSSRYGEIALMLIPLCVCAWSRWLDPDSVFFKKFKFVFWAILFINFSNDWTAHIYGNRLRDSLAGIDCLNAHWHRGRMDSVLCQTLYPAPLNRDLDRIANAEGAFLNNLGHD